jgi:diadenosine tetraphosphatase ApaH/serine/threonine PP2A family protein phosphatase
MRILIISDIHANFTALNAVLDHVGTIDAAWCLGDLVGYGPDPNECIQRVRELPNLICILGNHDAAALDQIDSATFNPEARQALQWTQNALTEESLTFLKRLPERVDTPQVTLVHGSPRQPVWEYLLDTFNATRCFEYFDTPYCFVGHTHLPIIFHLQNPHNMALLQVPEPDSCPTLQPRSIINPGSVGQPRDRDPRAAFAIYDSDNQRWEYQRVAYDISAVQSRMLALGLPDRHIQRLAAGW